MVEVHWHIDEIGPGGVRIQTKRLTLPPVQADAIAVGDKVHMSGGKRGAPDLFTVVTRTWRADGLHVFISTRPGWY